MSKRAYENDDDDDGDYMSDTILAAAAKASGPQLLNPRRRIPAQPPPTATTKSRQIIEKEQREQGLSTAITSNNKGFQLLKKMGYREGSTLGATQSNGLLEPIPIKMHPSRSGLGEETDKKEKILVKQEIKNKFQQQTQATYQDHLKQKYQLKRLRIDIAKCQSVCERLDKEKFNLEENVLWKKRPQTQTDQDDNDDEQDDNQDFSSMETLLHKLTTYLREQHLYCIWCGQTFSTLEELQNTCPGNERDLH